MMMPQIARKGEVRRSAALRVILVLARKDDRVGMREFLARHEIEILQIEGDLHASSTIGVQPQADVVILDAGLGDRLTFQLCNELRWSSNGIPLIVLGKGTESEIDRILLLEIGADDFISESVSQRELLARIRAVVRGRGLGARQTSDKSIKFQIGVAVFVPAARSVCHRDKITVLTEAETRLLSQLVRLPLTPISRLHLRTTHRAKDPVSSRTIDVCVMRIRKIIEPDPSNPRFVVTVRGEGYMFVPGLPLAPDGDSDCIATSAIATLSMSSPTVAAAVTAPT